MLVYDLFNDPYSLFMADKDNEEKPSELCCNFLQVSVYICSAKNVFFYQAEQTLTLCLFGL